jgi:hypothetical protein
LGIVSSDQVNDRMAQDRARIMGQWQEQLDAAQARADALRTQLGALDNIIATVPPGNSDKPPGADPTKDQVKAGKAYDDLIEKTEARVASLEAEATALGLTATQSQSLLNVQGLIADAEATGIEMTEPRIQQLLRLADAITDAEMTLEGLQITLENRSPWEVMAEEVSRLNDLMEKGKITAADYWTEVGKAAEDMVGKYATAANGILGSFETIADARSMQGQERIAMMEDEVNALLSSGKDATDAQKKLNKAIEAEGLRAFETDKQISIARAIIAGGESIVKSYNWGTTIGGPIGGAIAAGLAAAATVAQIGAIASTSYHSKAPVTAGGSGGGGSGAGQGGASASSGAQQAATVVLRGQFFSAESVADLLKNLIKDGGAPGLVTVIHEAA